MVYDDSDWDRDLRNAKAPQSRFPWFAVIGVVVVILSFFAALKAHSFTFFLFGFVYSMIFFGFHLVLEKLNDVLFEVRNRSKRK